jgi:hypothetical protein
MDIYLDHNAMVSVMEGRDMKFAKNVWGRGSLGDRFFYSPAHIEEIANIYRHCDDSEKADEYVQGHLNFLMLLTSGWEYLPPPFVRTDPGWVVQENPIYCLKRVLDGFDITLDVENHETQLRELVPAKEMKPVPDNVFEDEKLLGIVERRLDDPKWAFELPIPKGVELRKNDEKLWKIVDILYRSLQDLGYGLEPKKNTRSAIHDVTHMRYGLICFQ